MDKSLDWYQGPENVFDWLASTAFLSVNSGCMSQINGILIQQSLITDSKAVPTSQPNTLSDNDYFIVHATLLFQKFTGWTR